jgi:hypothetical protein
VPTETTAVPVTDDVTDRPTRNDGVAPADPDLVPTDDVPFADDGNVTVDDVARTYDAVTIEDAATVV